MTTYLGKSCSFGFPRVPFVNCRKFMYLVISLLVLRAGCGIWLYQFLIIAYLFTLVIFRPQCIDSGYLVSATPHTILYQSFSKLCTCFLHSLKIVMWFGYNTCFNFCYFFHFANFVIFWPQILWKCCDSGYLVSATPHAILYRSFWNFAYLFAMVCRCPYGLNIILELIFVTFSTLWTLSFSDLRFYESVETVGTLWAQLLIQFYTDLYETLHIFVPWSWDVHVVWI